MTRGHALMRKIMRTVAGSLVLGLLAVASCKSIPFTGDSKASKAARQAEEIQVEIMAFADSYTAVIAQAIDRIARALPEYRSVLHDAKVRNVTNAVIIAAGSNPVGGLLDMTVMVSLQRQMAEEYWIPERYGEAGQPLADALELLEEEIWLIAERRLEEDEVEALRALIPEIRARFRGQVLVSSIRASDFAEDRRGTVANLEGGGNLLTLFQLDPLAGMSPAAQELAQSRMLAERAFFWAKRLPLLMNWQAQDLILETLVEPELREMVASTRQLSESSARMSAVAEGLSESLPAEREKTLEQVRGLVKAEREAAIEQFAAMVAEEREAALDRAFEGIADEREAILRTFEQEDVRLRGLLEDLRLTVEATTALSASLTETMNATDRMRTGFARPPDAPPSEARPFDITEFQATAEATTATVQEMNRLIGSLTELMASDGGTQLTAATEHAQGTLEALIDRGFRRGLILIGVLIAGSLVAAIFFRMISARLGAPRAS
jgi:hypothetical protein